MAIPLTIHEISTGAAIDKTIFEAQTILNERVRAQAIYIAHLRAAHCAPESKYELTDWFQGFTEVAQPAPPAPADPIPTPAPFVDWASPYATEDDHSENDE